MDYELALKLHNAGFPKGEEGYGVFPSGETVNHTFIGDGNSAVYVPSLSELIEACGDRFRWLEYKPFKGVDDKHKWLAQARGIQFIRENGSKATTKNSCSFAQTPKEAVSNLWLEINKK